MAALSFYFEECALFSVAEEAALSSATEAIVGVLVVRFIGDHAVVASLLRDVSDDHRPRVGHTLADFGHGLRLIALHVVHPFDRLRHVPVIVFTFGLFSGLKVVVFHHLHESLTLTTSCRLVIYFYREEKRVKINLTESLHEIIQSL